MNSEMKYFGCIELNSTSYSASNVFLLDFGGFFCILILILYLIICPYLYSGQIDCILYLSFSTLPSKWINVKICFVNEAISESPVEYTPV